jgi:hypothetical protein
VVFIHLLHVVAVALDCALVADGAAVAVSCAIDALAVSLLSSESLARYYAYTLSSPAHRTTALIVRTLQAHGRAQLVGRAGLRCPKAHMRAAPRSVRVRAGSRHGRIAVDARTMAQAAADE